MSGEQAGTTASTVVMPDRYRAIFQQAAVGIAQIATDGRFVDVNEPLCAMLGYSRAELLSLDEAGITHPHDAQTDITELARLQRGEILSYAREKRFFRHDGRPLWTLAISSAVRDDEGRLSYRVMVVHDIEKRKAIEEALLRRNRQLALLSETAEELLVSNDPLNYLDLLFQRLAAHLDLQVYFHYQAEADGTLKLTAHHGVSNAVAAALDIVAADHPVFGVNSPERHTLSMEDIQNLGDPRAEPVRSLGITALVCQPLMGRNGWLGTVAFGSRTRTSFDAESLALVWALCDQAVVAIERKQAEDALREADRRKDEFLAMLAHELRNPLAAILNAVQLIDVLNVPKDKLHSVSNIIKRQLSHLTHLIDDLLDVARITRGKINLQKRVLELQAVVAQAIETSRPVIDARGHHFKRSLPEQKIHVFGDPVRLGQVISNLLNNAAKYTDPGGQITLEVEQRDSLAIVRVRDTGMGISAEMLPHVFELFAQANVELDRAQGGLGVGLTLARALVHLHGGELEAFSRGIGSGSEFVMKLPLEPSPDHEETRVPLAEVKLATPAQLRILVVDDNQDAAQTMAMLLRFDGHLVETAFDGPEALDVASRFTPDIVMLDLGLPGLTGLEVARRLRVQPRTRRARLIALTGYGQDEDHRRSQEAGFDLHLVKPVDKAQLDQVLVQLSTKAAIPDSNARKRQFGR
jgi:PAS domain S-box-containing protein